MKRIGIFLLLIFIISCSGIQMISSKKDYYSGNFLKKIESIQAIYRDGLRQEALTRLRGIKDSDINEASKAKKYNFIGIIFFTNDDIKSAISNFKKATEYFHEDEELKSQILLNLSSSYYKIEEFDYSKSYLSQINPNVFNDEEKSKYYKLSIALASRYEDFKTILQSSFHLASHLDSFEEVREFEYLSLAKSSFSRLSQSERIYYLENNSSNILSAYLAKEEAFRKISAGDKEGSISIIDWLDSNFGNVAQIQSIVSDFKENLANFSLIDSKALGVILPLSGKHRKFGLRALRGIDTYLKSKGFEGYKLHVKDGANNTSVASKALQELVKEHKVSVVIGGVFSSSAKAQYLEARKFGVMFISLSQVNLPREEKTAFLLEVPGSIQSQIAAISSSNFIANFGKRVALLYPKDEKGETYSKELWSLHQSGVIELTAINSYSRNLTDYRDPVSNLLGLKFKRQRKEEYETWKKIFEASKKKTYVRRKQILKPIIDFDWVFIPSYPPEAIQILPTFKWFDAKVRIVGPPSWNSRKIIKNRSSLGRLLFVGDNLGQLDEEFKENFKSKNNYSPRLVETLAYEGINLAMKAIGSRNYQDRGEFMRTLISMPLLEGISGKWIFQDTLWVKKMNLLTIKNSSVENVLENI
ncbi:MAG: ABC transporter substrate-binding protein [Bacteriovoracaceae bacterium]|jgi:ABC-type branched-subunit amino acid transport system substrate-binding protein|nr:ABC transporter substrate-binding protein [Bacteriovoracaceae bacterium]